VAYVSFSKIREKLMADPDFVKEYHDLDEEFDLVKELIKARKEAGLTQIEVAEKMGTSQSQITRLESGKGTISSLRRYAKATGKKVKITLV
jgi:DNA-directed RNA polymerase specialized sigma subunit